MTIDACNFTRLDGNAVMVSGYNRNTTISNSEFSWLGGNAMAGWGFTNETSLEGERKGRGGAAHGEKEGFGGGGHPSWLAFLR